MVEISRKTYQRNGIETIIDIDGILWLNEKHTWLATLLVMVSR